MGTVLVLLAVTLWLWRAEGLINKYLDSKVLPVSLPPITKSDPVPEDLAAYAKNYDQPWAKQQTLEGLYEMRGELGSWADVRKGLGMSAGTM